MTSPTRFEMCVVGGAGHVGLPFAVALANRGIRTAIFDVNVSALDVIETGRFPFKEDGGDEALRAALARGTLTVSCDARIISESEFVTLVIGTPIDEYLNPDMKSLLSAIKSNADRFRDGQILMLRSTVFPGTSEVVQRLFTDQGKKVSVVFCPERIVQGQALKEITALPQIISGFDEASIARVEALFRRITEKKIIRLKPMEAELAKLYCNAWRYIRFAVANQFYMIAQTHGLDYARIFDAIREDYPRMQDMPGPGFAAGPCLLKDTMQLAAFSRNQFFLGHAAMLVNEGLPNFLLQELKRAVPDLRSKTLGILGMAFKSESDDKRDSLSFKLRKLAKTECAEVLCHDPHMQNPTFHTLETVLAKSHVVIVGTPHDAYKTIERSRYPHITFVDIWGVLPTSEQTSTSATFSPFAKIKPSQPTVTASEDFWRFLSAPPRETPPS